MTAIDTTMLAAMRSAISELLPDTCHLLSPTNTPDGAGGVSQTWGTTSTNVSCRLDVVTGHEQALGGAWQPYTRTTLSLPYDTTITSTMRVLHGGITYAVTGNNNDQSWIAVKRVDLEKV